MLVKDLLEAIKNSPKEVKFILFINNENRQRKFDILTDYNICLNELILERIWDAGEGITYDEGNKKFLKLLINLNKYLYKTLIVKSNNKKYKVKSFEYHSVGVCTIKLILDNK